MYKLPQLVLALYISLLYLFQASNGARILASVATPSYSHQVAFRFIWKGLAERGHEVVLLTTDPMKENIPNLRQIDLSTSYDVIHKYNFSSLVTNNASNGMWSFMTNGVVAMAEAQKQQLLSPEVQSLIHNSSEHFDLLMIEAIFPIHYGFIERFKVPVIGLNSLDGNRMQHLIMGNDDHMILHPFMGLTMSSPPTFRERIFAVLFNILMNSYGEFFVNPMMNKIIQEVFGKNSRPIEELIKETDMLFLNVNPALHPIRAVTPNTIMFGGGTHLDTVAKPLPEGIKKFLDSAPDGVIYFSLGSNVKSALIRDELRQLFLETFEELPYKVLWKFENKELPNKPDNVMIQKWVPQGDVLRHPNIKVFITQCGLQSMEEAIMNHIPLVGVPFFADQPSNAAMMANKGFGIHLDHSKLTKELFKETILEVINNRKYKDKAIEIADLFRDVEMTGLEKVVWWTEYVIRNKGAKLFRNPIIDLPFYQYYLLDVIGFVGLICFIVSFGVIKISLFLFRQAKQLISKKTKKD
ncbi:UDP-glycosyltransferase UGT5-like isoform X1 [Harmonia axyridis]|uniref:UDP-glycosyltransferase UGT5-like isoform X1 n=1 Tax=Harmonia axyridis TaxID=115357 RepID=UPI001E274F7D|nr:UDP-glycosyltransferase UGT5-like isoform X1 [Harmonia axyridis]